MTDDPDAIEVEVAREESELAGRGRQRGEDRIGVAAEILLTARLTTQRREDVAKPQADVIGADDDEPTAGPVGHLRQRLGAPRSRAVDEHDHREAPVLLVERQLRVAVTHLQRILVVGDLGLLGLGQRVANVVGHGIEAGFAAPLRRVPDLGGHTVDVDRARADGPRSALGWIGGHFIEGRVIAAGDLIGCRIAIAIAITVAGIAIAIAIAGIAITGIAIAIAGITITIAVARFAFGAGVAAIARRIVVRTRDRWSEQTRGRK